MSRQRSLMMITATMLAGASALVVVRSQRNAQMAAYDRALTAGHVSVLVDRAAAGQGLESVQEYLRKNSAYQLDVYLAGRIGWQSKALPDRFALLFIGADDNGVTWLAGGPVANQGVLVHVTAQQNETVMNGKEFAAFVSRSMAGNGQVRIDVWVLDYTGEEGGTSPIRSD